MSELLTRLKKSSSIKEAEVITKSKIYGKKDMIPTDIPMINVALSGEIDGGLTPGVTVLAGKTKHFKSCFSLIMASAYQKKYPNGIVLFYDSEFGMPESYLKKFDIDVDRVLHTPITDIEQLKHDIMLQLKEINRGDKVFILVDSLGNLASKKEVEDALSGKVAADMTKAKANKSLFRMVTPHLTIKDIPMVVVNHVYDEIGMFPKAVVSGGTGIMYSADNVWIIGRQQEKEGTEISGYHFIINIEKSRYVKEKSKIPITVTWERGVNKWSGFFDIALQGKYITKPVAGWYEVAGGSGKRFRAKEILDNDDFWCTMLKTTDLAQYIKRRFKMDENSPVVETVEEDIENDLGD